MTREINFSVNDVDESTLSSKHFSTLIDRLILILLPLIAVISILLLKFAFLFNMDSDPLWSIAVGEWINTYGTVPRVDVFSWTVAGEEWFSNSWLFCWLMYWADQTMGYLGIGLMISIPCLITGYFLFFMCKNYNDSALAIIVFMTGIFFLIVLTVTPRAYIFTFAFVAVIMYLLRFKRNTKLIYLIPVIFLIWSNMQCSMRFGVGIVFIEALVGSVFYKDNRLWPVVGLSFLATLINPYGFGFWDFSLAGFLTPGVQYLSEWRAPDFNILGMFILYSFMFLFGLLGASRLKDDFNNRIFDRDKIMIFFWFWAAFIYSLTTARAIQYVLLLLAPYFTAFMTKSSGESRYLKPVILVLAFIIFLISVTSSLPLIPLELDEQSGKPATFVDYMQEHSLSLSPERVSLIFPSDAVNFLKANPAMLERLFNSYPFGGYLLLNNIEVFIDARASVFTRHSVTDDHFQVRLLAVKPELIIDKYDINTFFIAKSEPLFFYLEVHPEWEKKYEDNTVVIFTRLNLD